MICFRAWQEEALRKFVQTDGNFLCVAAPGAGKTRFALAAFNQVTPTRLIVVVPTRHLRKQWASAAIRDFKIKLDHEIKNQYGAIRGDMDGVVVTYSAVASNPALWRRLCVEESTLVIFDEIHHCADEDNSTWGPAIKSAFGRADRKLLLSGTPFRTRNEPIPFVTYGEDGYCDTEKGGYRYTYKEAYNDGVVRPVVFEWHDGENAYSKNGELFEHTSLQVAVELGDLPVAMKAIHGTGDFAPSMLKKAHDYLMTRHRAVMRDAGGLVVARDIEHAKMYARYLEGITGTMPAIVHSEEPEATATIERFAKSAEPWLVSVKMVSEGVDIPRLTYLVYATNIMTPMFWEQALGRIIRMRTDADAIRAVMAMPDLPGLRKFAAEIEEAIKDIEKLKAATGNGGGGVGGSFPDDSIPVSSGNTDITGYTFGGDLYGKDEIAEALELRQRFTVPDWVADAEVAGLVRAIRSPGPSSSREEEQSEFTVTPGELAKALSKQVNTQVNVLHKITNQPRNRIHSKMNELCNEKSVHEAKIETLNYRLELLREAIQQAREQRNGR